LSISKDAEATTSLDNLFQCLTILTVKMFLLMFKWNFLYFSLCPLPHLLTGYHWEESGSIFTASHPVSIPTEAALQAH